MKSKKIINALMISLLFLSSCKNNPDLNSEEISNSLSNEPTLEPTVEITPEPTLEPTIEPTIEPTVEPTIEPSLKDIYNDYDDVELHVGGDETNEKNYLYKDKGSFKTGAFSYNNQEIKYVINPQSKPQVFVTTTYIYSVDSEEFKTSKEYSNGYTSILYTPDFYFSHTNASENYIEYIANYNYDSESYIINEINESGGAYIPLDGIVLAISKDNSLSFEIGDKLNLDSSISRYEHSLINQDNIRMPFGEINKYRSNAEVILYDREYGNYTKTNQHGCETYFKFDFESNCYKVVGFRGHNKEVGDLQQSHTTYGGYIPKHGFAISAHVNATNYETYRQGRKFNIGDTITFENYSISNKLDNATFSKYYFDNPSNRPYNVLCKYDYGNKVLDEYGYTNNTRWEAIEVAVIPVSSYGVVVAYDREIGCPKDGYILSCNGPIATELAKVIKHGSLIRVTDDKVYVNNELGISEITNIEFYKDVLLNKYDTGMNELFDYDYLTLKSKIEDLEEIQNKISDYYDYYLDAETLSEMDKYETLIKQLYIDATNNYYEGYCASTQSNYVEAKAAWLVPHKCNSLSTVMDYIRNYKECNVNLIYLCVFDGQGLFHSDMVPFNGNFAGDFGEYGKDNFLEAFVEEAHKEGIEVHAWSTNFHVGFSGNTNKLFNDHPKWQQVYYDGKVDSNDEMTEQTLLYFDQANPEVHQFLVDYYNEIFEKFDFDGLHLDYVRYAAGNDVGHEKSVYCAVGQGKKLWAENCLNRTTGYTTYAMNDFKEKYNIAGDVKEAVMDVETYNLWTKYRSDQLTSFVEKVYNEVKVKNNTFLSLACVAEKEFAYLNKMQDWSTWVNNGWIDQISGMFYSSNPNRNVIDINKASDSFEVPLYQYPGFLVHSYFNFSTIYNVYLHEAQFKASGMGGSVFDANCIYSHERIIYSNSFYDTKTLLAMSLHRNASVLPHDDLNKVYEMMIYQIEKRCDDIYIPYGNMSEEKKNSLINEMKTFDFNNPETLKSQLENLQNNLDLYCEGNVKERINEQLDLMIYICEIKSK